MCIKRGQLFRQKDRRATRLKLHYIQKRRGATNIQLRKRESLPEHSAIMLAVKGTHQSNVYAMEGHKQRTTLPYITEQRLSCRGTGTNCKRTFSNGRGQIISHSRSGNKPMKMITKYADRDRDQFFFVSFPDIYPLSHLSHSHIALYL